MSNPNKASIEVGVTVEVKNFVITDEKVISAFKVELEEGRSAETYLQNIISVGNQVLGIANAGAGVEKLSDGIAQTEKAMASATKKFNEDISKKMEEITGEDSALASKLNEIVDEFAGHIEGLTADEDSPIREGIKKQMADMAKKMMDDFTRQSLVTRDEILAKLNPETDGSPFAIFGHELETVKDGLATLNLSLAENKGKELESKKGTDKGRTFEKKVMDVVASIASGSGDDAEHTGDIPGLTGRMGDGVITAKSGLKRIARIVVEAKDKKLTEAAWHKEAAGSMKNRDAIGFLGVCKNLEDMPNKQRLIALDDVGQQLVVCFDPDGDEPRDLLALVYQVVKMHTLNVQNAGDNLNVQAMRLFVEQSLKQLEKFNRLSSLANGIKRDADKIVKESEDISDELTRHLRSLRREIIGVEPMKVIDSAELLELESSSEDEEV